MKPLNRAIGLHALMLAGGALCQAPAAEAPPKALPTPPPLVATAPPRRRRYPSPRGARRRCDSSGGWTTTGDRLHRLWPAGRPGHRPLCRRVPAGRDLDVPRASDAGAERAHPLLPRDADGLVPLLDGPRGRGGALPGGRRSDASADLEKNPGACPDVALVATASARSRAGRATTTAASRKGAHSPFLTSSRLPGRRRRPLRRSSSRTSRSRARSASRRPPRSPTSTGTSSTTSSRSSRTSSATRF